MPLMHFKHDKNWTKTVIYAFGCTYESLEEDVSTCVGYWVNNKHKKCLQTNVCEGHFLGNPVTTTFDTNFNKATNMLIEIILNSLK